MRKSGLAAGKSGYKDSGFADFTLHSDPSFDRLRKKSA